MGQAEDPRLQELGLAGAGRAAHKGVRTLCPQVDREDLVAAVADDGTEVTVALAGSGRLVAHDQ